MLNKQASKGTMNVSINKETKYLLSAALANVVAHLYFTLLVYPLHSERALGKSALLLSLFSALLWIFAVKKKVYHILLTQVPLLWLAGFFAALPPLESINQYSTELVLIDPEQHSQLAPMLMPSFLLPAFCLLIAYFFLTLRWLRVCQDSNSRQVNAYHYQVDRYRTTSLQKNKEPFSSLQLILPRLIKFLPIYWGLVLCISFYTWAEYSPTPVGIKDLENLPIWLSLFIGMAIISVFMASAILTLRLTPISYLVLERSGLLKLNQKWRKVTWLIFFLSLALIYWEMVY